MATKVFSILAVAAICHEANRALCEAEGDTSQVPFAEAAHWQRNSALKGVWFVLKNPDAPASANHASWLAEKEATGWKYGPTKDPEAKTHPCMVAFEDLPPAQQAKDHLFKGIVESLRPFIAIDGAATTSA